MPAWTRIQNLNGSEAFSRPLGLLESAHYWDTVCFGISDTLVQLMLEIPASESPSEVFSSHNVTRAWISTKKLHPLLGAKFYERPNAGGVDFVVSEARLNQISSDEIVYTTLQSDDDACALVDEILNGPRNLSNDQLAQLWIISFPGSSSYAFSYSPSTCYQLFLQMAHSIHDAAAQNTVIKTFLDILVHSSTLEKYIPKGTLESRLMLHLAIEDLSPSRKYSSARQRWRLAIAQVIHFRRATTWKGGHTLPRTITPLTPETPPVSRTFRLKFSKSLSERILTGCREAGITFGHALSVLSQLAHARVLHRLYARGALSEAEWNYQIRQPMHQSGPINLRPYLDQEWLSTGGAERVCMAVSFSRRTLPSMPVAREGSRVLENPPFDALLSSARFFHRCRTVKRQTVGLLTHPLQTEFAQIVSPARLEKSQLHALNWRAHIRAAIEGTRACNLSLSTPPPDECVLSIACSTVGDMSNVLPAKYPLDGGPTTTPLRINSIRHYLRCRPAELYISSISYHRELQLFLFCDIRTYDEALVREWLSDVKYGAEWYLGGTDVVSRANHTQIHVARL